MQDYRKRCAVDETVPLSVAPGAMDETFRLASSAAFASLEPVVLSSNPWVLQFDAFLSDDEADAFIRGGATKGWALSEDAGAPPTAAYSVALLPRRLPPLTAYHRYSIDCGLLLTTHHSLLTTHYSPLTTHHSPLTTLRHRSDARGRLL